MALTSQRWILAALLGCGAIAAGLVSPRHTVEADSVESPEQMHLRRVQRRTFDAARRWKATARRDSLLSALGATGSRHSGSAIVVTDPRLPEPHRLLIERAVERQWRMLHIDSALVPVSLAVVVDTVPAPKDSPAASRGELAFDYSLATDGSGADARRCVVILGIHAPQLARQGAHRRLAERLAPTQRGDALLGPCAFQARFGVAGPKVDEWLRSREYDLASSAVWEEPARDGPDQSRGPYPREGMRAAQRWIGIDARACIAGDVQRCSATMAPRPGAGERIHRSGLVSGRPRGWEESWNGLAARYLSDLVTDIGPDAFGRFWRSDLGPDDALQAAAGVTVGVWTNRWAVGVLGPVRRGPGVAVLELAGALVLAVGCLATAAWGWGRRQVR